MTRHVVALVFAALALVCLLQSTSAVDWLDYVRERLLRTIESEHITCSTYKEFCDKSSSQPLPNDEPQDAESIKSAAQFCKVILRVYVCDVDLDKELNFDEE